MGEEHGLSAQPGSCRLADAQCKGRSDGGVERVAAGLEDLDAGFGCAVVSGGDDSLAGGCDSLRPVDAPVAKFQKIGVDV